MIPVIVIVLGIVMLGAAFAAIYFKSLLASIISAGVISLFASVLYLILGSPDVAMTEATIGSGLTTVVFLFALYRVRKGNLDD
ncbi:MAG: DUF4040 domain-containing protein [Candidatus Fermentibacteraceae bacterium]|nr:DUF4040 domain-containing protein [Candidatus Fermentibacteraceae bacterium]